MRLITLAPTDVVNYDIIALHGEMTFGHGTKRSQRAKLINGDVYFHNAGYTDKDRDCSIKVEVTLENAKDLDIWLRDSVEFIFHDDMGSYIGVLNALSIDGVQADLTVWVKELLGLVSDEIYPVPAPPAPPTPDPEWHDVTDNTYWSGGSGNDVSWNFFGQYWVAEGIEEYFYLNIVVNGSWANGFAPTKFRITYSLSNCWLADQFYINGVTGSIYEGYPNSNIEVSVTVNSGTGDIESLVAEWINDDYPNLTMAVYISKIEFYGVKTW